MNLDLAIDAWLWRSTLAGLLVAVVAAPVGVVLYYRRASMMLDAAAHSALPGIVFGVVLFGAVSPAALLIGALGAALATSWLVEWLSSYRTIRPDGAIGAVFTSMLAMGVIVLSMRLKSVHLDPAHALFGDLLAVSSGSLAVLSVAAAISVGGVLVCRRAIEVSSFDGGFAEQVGLSPRWAGRAVLGAACLVAVACFEAVGAVLVVAMASVPASAGHLVGRSLLGTVSWAVAFGAAGVLLGLAVSVRLDVSPSGAIVSALGAGYVAVRLWSDARVREPGRIGDR